MIKKHWLGSILSILAGIVVFLLIQDTVLAPLFLFLIIVLSLVLPLIISTKGGTGTK